MSPPSSHAPPRQPPRWLTCPQGYYWLVRRLLPSCTAHVHRMRVQRHPLARLQLAETRATRGRGWLAHQHRGFGKPASAAGVGAAVSVGGVGVEGVGGGMAGGVLAAIAGRRPRRQRRRQRWPAPASGAGRHLEMGLGPVNEQAGQNVRAWRLGANMPGLGMRSGGCGCEMQGPRGAGGGYTSSGRSR